jgi:hydrogenase maturation protein HypF
MPGGDLATRFPARMVAGILSRKYSTDELKDILTNHVADGFKNKKEIEIVLQQIQKRFNAPETTSTGRVLDAISALLGVSVERTYEGEPAIKLESFASGGRDSLDFPVEIKKIDDRYVLDTTRILDTVLILKEEHAPNDVAASAQRALSDGFAEIASKVAKSKKIDTIGISGGVAYNEAIVRNLREKLQEKGFDLLTHLKVPPGDGGVSLGQACIAAGRMQ